ncbi:type II toxin-antitoxin system RelE/ParE family toxin [Nocardia sp. NPDC057227]|uniref:type II toxin-antitoxin system RelE family toxin n=1 Tax=Nocardia sp. NPDC057227 TaxID=3346056 RepID=UPI00362EC4FE
MQHEYEVTIAGPAERQLRKIAARDRAMAKDLLDAIDGLKRDPRPDGCKKLRGVEGYRLRVHRFRILYTVSDREIRVRVFRVADRKEVYRDHR